MAVKVPQSKKSTKPAQNEDDEIEILDGAEEVVEGPTEEEAEIVQFALTVDIDPAPRVGNIDLVKELGVSKLTKGIQKIPRVVAEVLADKGYGQIVG